MCRICRGIHYLRGFLSFFSPCCVISDSGKLPVGFFDFILNISYPELKIRILWLRLLVNNLN
jgi:hypothetical protein